MSSASLIGKKHGEPLRRPKFRCISREVWVDHGFSSLGHHGLLIVCRGKWQRFVVAKLLYKVGSAWPSLECSASCERLIDHPAK